MSTQCDEIREAFKGKDALRLRSLVQRAIREYKQRLEATNPGVTFAVGVDLKALKDHRDNEVFHVILSYETHDAT